jgi:CRISPR-associated endonuclease Cas1/CRISPR-associated protein Cas4
MINEFVYCPRLFALEHLDGQWADSADTVRGQRVHKRVDRDDRRPDPDEDDAPTVRRSLHLGCERLGVVAKVDLVELQGDRAVPVDYKKGRVPPGGPWDPERVQVCLQALLLRSNGFVVDEGVLYFAGSRRRVTVAIDDDLVARTQAAIDGARALLDAPRLPSPLQDSPKCPRCSLVGICLPDEHHALEGAQKVRPLLPPRLDAVPLHVEQRGAKLTKQGGEIVVKVDGKAVERVRIRDTSAVVVSGAVSITSPLLQALIEANVPLSLHRWSGQHVGDVVPVGGHHALGRVAQHEVVGHRGRSLAIARCMVAGKIHNQRVLLRRNVKGDRTDLLRRMKDARQGALAAGAAVTLLGYEGTAAKNYFGSFARMLGQEELAERFEANGRNRRPPRDPVNALLSFAYAMLARECTTVLHRVGLDPFVGVYHRLRPGRAALALDLMEEFRPIIADSVVLRVVNTGVVQPDDFLERSTGVRLRDAGRRKFIRAFEERMAETVRHPRFDTSLAYRRILEVQARLLSKAMMREIASYPAFVVR